MQNLMYSMMSNSNRFPISQFDSMAIESNWTEFRIGFQMMNSVFDSIRFDEFGGCNVKRYVLSRKRRFVRYIVQKNECNVKTAIRTSKSSFFTLHFTRPGRARAENHLLVRSRGRARANCQTRSGCVGCVGHSVARSLGRSVASIARSRRSSL